ncbi:cytochrome P450 (plasmid) [Amycolatopsis sp. FU40]|uniref:cytochrome P450 n=1 Tax=Amycolatopsis sp. FU40 TaxID=2914159 RepID=UPI001F39D86A|nr:cytochrome P450 [Amycolatopsis sp. FU40]UKD50897.1 cytochrome P450 [Amycolatopsis sp. FU40]
MNPAETASSPAADFDHLDPVVASDIYARLDTIRSGCPVARSGRHGGFWLVTGYDEIRHIGKDGDVFGSYVEGLGAAAVVAGVEKQERAPLFEIDGKAHLEWWRVLQPWFTPAAAKEREEHVRALCRETIADFAARGRADLVTAYTQRIPPLVIGAMLGLNSRDCTALSRRVRALSNARDAESAQDAGDALGAFLRDQVRRRMTEDLGDMLSAIAHARVDGRRTRESEVLKFMFTMIAAGNLTTTDACANILVEVLDDHALRDRCAADPAYVQQVIEESVRHEPPVAATGRTVRAETELAGVALVPGDRVVIPWGAANRDPAYYPDGHQFRPGRDRPVPPHLGWGAGAHRCLGRHVARMELAVMLEELLAALPDLRWQPGAVVRRTYGVIRGVRAVDAEWTPRLSTRVLGP